MFSIRTEVVKMDSIHTIDFIRFNIANQSVTAEAAAIISDSVKLRATKCCRFELYNIKQLLMKIKIP
jgi:hypothetical protein